MRVARELAQTGEYRADVSRKVVRWRLAEHLKVQIRYGGAQLKLDLARIKASSKHGCKTKSWKKGTVDEKARAHTHHRRILPPDAPTLPNGA